MGGWDVVRFIWVQLEACPQVPNVRIYRMWKKSSLVFIKPGRKTRVQGVCAKLTLNPLEPVQFAPGPRQLLDRPGGYKMQEGMESMCY